MALELRNLDWFSFALYLVDFITLEISLTGIDILSIDIRLKFDGKS